MSHAATSQFFEGIRSLRLLDESQVGELQARPEAVWGDVVSLAQYTQERGWLTPYQARELRDGRGSGLAVGGYVIQDRITEGPNGITYRATHPALDGPVLVRLFSPHWLAPGDAPADYVARVQAASLVHHPHLAAVLDVGSYQEFLFVVQEFVEGCDLFRLVNEMGALPVSLACEYVRQAALALAAAHDRGVVHGDVSSHTLMLTPVKRFTGPNGDMTFRPLPGASTRLMELALVPRRPAVNDTGFAHSDRLGTVAFYPPERLGNGEPTPAGDSYGLGATLYHLLTTRPPQAGSTPLEVLLNLQQSEPVPIQTLRSDVPPAVADLTARLLSRDPAVRPTAAQIAEVLSPYGEPTSRAQAAAPVQVAVPLADETFTKPGVPTAVPVATNLDQPAFSSEAELFAEPLDDHPSADALAPPVHAPLVEPISERHLANEHYEGQEFVSGMHPGGVDAVTAEPDEQFGHTAIGTDTPRAPRPRVKASGKNMVWIIAGLCLHLTAVTLLVGYLTNWFAFARSQPSPPSRVEEKKDPPKSKPKPPRRDS